MTHSCQDLQPHTPSAVTPLVSVTGGNTPNPDSPNPYALKPHLIVAGVVMLANVAVVCTQHISLWANSGGRCLASYRVCCVVLKLEVGCYFHSDVSARTAESFSHTKTHSFSAVSGLSLLDSSSVSSTVPYSGKSKYWYASPARLQVYQLSSL